MLTKYKTNQSYNIKFQVWLLLQIWFILKAFFKPYKNKGGLYVKIR